MLLVIEYSIAVRNVERCAARSDSARRRAAAACRGTNGISTGVGLPIVSVRMPIWLWKYDVVRMPPLNQVEYGRAGPHHRARLSFGRQPRVDRGADRVDAERNQRIEVVVERIAERRREQHRAGRAGLMMVVHDRGEPLAIHHPVRVHALRHVHHVEVAVVVVADVLLVEPRDAARWTASSRPASRMYQSDTSSMPSGLTSVQRMTTSLRIRSVSGIRSWC